MASPDQKKLRTAVKKFSSNKKITLDDVLSFAKLALIACGKDTQSRENDAIDAIREEVARLQSHDLSKNHLPSAKEELDTAVRATEEAASHILACAETVMAVDANNAESYESSVNVAMLEILEACAFQDISGQHMSKVAETLNRIDRRITRFAKTSGVRDWKGEASDCEAHKNKRQKDLILNGPASNDDGLAQDDIDALLAG